ncbi:MAG: DNA polymerase III subunit beta [Turicibacter sp.]|nr:DNA polymerase III subunit beta [Turicibacter sp.]
MKIRCAKERLIENLGLVGKVVSARTPMPILECVLLTADENGIRLTANDSDMAIETAYMDADVQEHGNIAIEARLFTDMVRKMPDSELSIETGENREAVCKSGRAKFTLPFFSGEEFPAMEQIEDANSYNIPTKEFRDMIRQTIFSVATDDTRPILMGELIEQKDNALHMVAVDGFRISYKRLDLNEDQRDPFSAVIPGKALHELSRILPTNDEENTLTFSLTDKKILFRLPSFTFVSRLLEGEFVRYDQIFNEDRIIDVTTGRQMLLSSLERATLVARENKKSPVKLEITESSMIITSNTELGTVFDEIQATVSGDGELPLEIAFNPKYLMEALKALEEENILMHFTSNLSPCIIRGESSELAKYLVLPLRLY